MKRLLFIGLALLTSSVAGAQASYQFTNFQTIANGFTTTLLFRNINAFPDPRVISLESFQVHTSQRLHDFCSGAVLSCSLNGAGAPQGGPTYTIGPVQTADFIDNNGTIFIQNSYSEDSCGNVYCMSRAFFFGRVFGCPLPAPAVQGGAISYTARSCDALGHTGSVAVNLQFTHTPLGPAAASPFDVSDLSASFEVRDWGTNVAVVPEPSTYVLLAIGLVAVGVVRRKRPAK